jgi:CheY-like chemotaxis protein
MTPARILIAVSNRELSGLLRAGFEKSDLTYVVVEVPSGEEALLELGRGPLNLLVTDDSLPGLSGLELVKKAHQVKPTLKTILIREEDDESESDLPETQGLIKTITKPIDVDLFFQTVEEAFSDDQALRAPVDIEHDNVLKQLEDLRNAIQAGAVFLIDERGQVVLQAGKLLVLNLGAAFPSMRAALAAGQKTSRVMGSVQPETLMFFRGGSHDLFLTNVGLTHALLMVYHGRQPFDAIRAVQEYALKTAAALASILSEGEIQPKPAASPIELTEEEAAEPMPMQEKQAPEQQAEEPILEVPDEDVSQEDAENFWESVVAGTSLPYDSDSGISYQEAREMGLVKDEPSDESE